MNTTEKTTNRLINEKSPYLLQHAYNPVDWWPWCDEAFAKAKAEDKPVFLSVGYSTCHWCHVMEKESFEDAQTAAVLNSGFVSIKVDREERPDVDAVYMSVTQMLTGRGGWPMSVFMSWDKRPFYAGTYFPKEDGIHGAGFITLLNRLSGLWQTDRQRLMSAGREILSALAEPDKTKDIDYGQAIQKGYYQLRQSFDPRYGGFGHAPKFPTPHNLLLLLRYYHAYKEPDALAMAEKTLMSLYKGGIHDHVGGGFCRYSTDNRWLAPHFEKMLYDNALLAAVYTEAFLLTKNPLYKRAAEEIFTYLQRDMLLPEGAFSSAEDADSEGVEGKFYTFTKSEIISLLGVEEGERFCRAYDVSPKGNFEGANIINLIENENYQQVVEDDFYASCLQKLFVYREQRIRPLKDDKILAAWNGLVIYALAYAGRAFDKPEYIAMAQTAADFILTSMTDAEGKLLTRYREGEARFSGVAEDYAFVIMGLLELYQAGFNAQYLAHAYRLGKILVAGFFEDGALYQTEKDGEALIFRPRELYDGALPSYNSVGVMNFAKLAHLCGDQEFMAKATAIIRFFGADIEQAPAHFCFALCGMMQLNSVSRQIVMAGPKSAEFVKIINEEYQPFATLAFADAGLAREFGAYGNYQAKDGKPAVYICEANRCEQPLYDAEELRKRLLAGFQAEYSG